MERDSNHLAVLEYLRKHLDGTLTDADTTHMVYPTAISRTLDLRIAEIGPAMAVVEIDADSAVHGNQQGTVHGGLVCELADAAIGTAHSTLMEDGETFTTIELKVNFIRPVWKSTLRAVAKPAHRGRRISYYICEIVRDDGKTVAFATSTVMTLRGDQARGR